MRQFITKFKKLVRNLEISSTARKLDRFFKRYLRIDRGERKQQGRKTRVILSPFLLISSRFAGDQNRGKRTRRQEDET